jgi:hypothetical protein
LEKAMQRAPNPASQIMLSARISRNKCGGEDAVSGGGGEEEEEEEEEEEADKDETAEAEGWQ